MFFVISKIFAFLCMPLSWCLLLLLASAIWKKRAKLLRGSAIVVLLVFSNQLILDAVNRAWETPISIDSNIPQCKVGIVLGGFTTYDTTAQRITFRMGSDRFAQGLRLLQTKKVDQLLISGGSGYLLAPELKEGQFVETYLDEIRVPARKILIESESRNTHENAVMSMSLLKERGIHQNDIILITSGFHMPRAKACFEKAGFNVIPYSTDPTVDGRLFGLDKLIPNPLVLSYWNVLIHEWIGYISYWIMGYV